MSAAAALRIVVPAALLAAFIAFVLKVSATGRPPFQPAAAPPSPPPQAATAARFNVLAFILDDAKPLLGAYACSPVRTPRIDALAARGTRFVNAHAQAAMCKSKPSARFTGRSKRRLSAAPPSFIFFTPGGPSRASFLTGRRLDDLSRDLRADQNFSGNRHATQYHFMHDGAVSKHRRLRPSVPSLPGWFRAQGYHTAGFGKIYHSHSEEDASDPSQWSSAVELAPMETQPTNHGFVVEDGRPETADAFPDIFVTDAAVRRLRAVAEDAATPFLLVVGYHRPHLPFWAPKRVFEQVDRELGADGAPLSRYPTPPDRLDAATSDLAMGPGDFEVGQYTAKYKRPPQGGYNAKHAFDARNPRLTKEEQRAFVRGYLACIAFVDEQVGVVLDALATTRAANNTAIVLFGDRAWGSVSLSLPRTRSAYAPPPPHMPPPPPPRADGYHLGDHGLFSKHTNFEQALRVPLVAVPARDDPRFRDGGATPATAAPAELLDVLPTLAALSTTAEAEAHPGWAGASLLPPMLRPARPGAETFVKAAAVSQWTRRRFEAKAAGSAHTGYVIRTARYRLVVWLRIGAHRWQLVDGKTHHSCLARSAKGAKTKKQQRQQKQQQGDGGARCGGLGGEEDLDGPFDHGREPLLQGSSLELYDVVADPHERVNLLGEPSTNETVALAESLLELAWGGAARTSTERFADLRHRPPPDVSSLEEAVRAATARASCAAYDGGEL